MWHLLINPCSFKFYFDPILTLIYELVKPKLSHVAKTDQKKKIRPNFTFTLEYFSPLHYCNFWSFLASAIKQFSLYLLFKNFTCTCLHCLLLTMRLWLSLFAVTDPQRKEGPWVFLFLYFEGGFIIYIPQKYKVIPWQVVCIYIVPICDINILL